MPILYNGRPCPPELPLPMEDLDLPLCNTIPQTDIIGAMMIVCRLRGKLSGLFCAILCATIVHSAMHTLMNRSNSFLDWVLSHWAYLTVLRLIFVWCITVCSLSLSLPIMHITSLMSIIVHATCCMHAQFCNTVRWTWWD